MQGMSAIRADIFTNELKNTRDRPLEITSRSNTIWPQMTLITLIVSVVLCHLFLHIYIFYRISAFVTFLPDFTSERSKRRDFLALSFITKLIITTDLIKNYCTLISFF